MRGTPTSIPWVGTTLRTLAGSIAPRDSEDVRNAATTFIWDQCCSVIIE